MYLPKRLNNVKKGIGELTLNFRSSLSWSLNVDTRTSVKSPLRFTLMLCVLAAYSTFAKTSRHPSPSKTNTAKIFKHSSAATPLREAVKDSTENSTEDLQPQASPLGAQGICTSDSFARQLLIEALNNQYRGHYQATLEVVNESFTTGYDSLAGPIDFSDEIGQRKICLASENQSIDYQSFHFGKEQWITDEGSHRVRRIANRQWKKGLFGNLLTYEDLLKWPSEYFLDYYASGNIKTTDSTYEFSMIMKPLIQTFYSSLDLVFARKPVLLKSMSFYGMQGQRLKTLEMNEYEKMDGKWLPSKMTVRSCDSLSNLKMCLNHFSFSNLPTQNISKVNIQPSFQLLSKTVSDTTLNKSAKNSEESEKGATQEVSN